MPDTKFTLRQDGPCVLFYNWSPSASTLSLIHICGAEAHLRGDRDAWLGGLIGSDTATRQEAGQEGDAQKPADPPHPGGQPIDRPPSRWIWR